MAMPLPQRSHKQEVKVQMFRDGRYTVLSLPLNTTTHKGELTFLKEMDYKCQLTSSIFLIKQWDNYEQANERIGNKAVMDILPFTCAEGGEGQLG